MLYKKLISKNLENLKIFSLDSRLKRALVIFAFCCQIISGFTEWLGIAPFLIDLLKPFFTLTLSNWIGNGMAVSLALFLEFLVFYLVGFIIHAIRVKYWAMDGDKIDRIFNQIKFWSAAVLLSVLIFVSMFLSKQNVKLQVAATTIEVPTVNLDKFDSKKAEKIEAIEARYLADKADLDLSLKDSKELTARAYRAKIDALNNEINILKRKEQRTGKSYISKKTFHNKEIAELRTQQAEELQQLRQTYDRDLATLKHNRSNDIYAVSDAINLDRGKASTSNDKTAAATAERNEWISWVLQIIASCAVLGFVVARSWVEMSDATAGIEKKVMPLQEFKGSNFWIELYLLCRLKIQRKLQNGIRKKLAAIPDLLPVEQTGALLAFDATLPYQATEQKRDLAKLFNSHNNEQTTGNGERDLYDFTDFSRNKKDGEHITATIEAPPTSTENRRTLFAEDFEQENDRGKDNSKIGRIGDRMPINQANLDNDRNKEKHKKKQKKRIVRYYKSYVKKHKKKPSYQTISDALNIAVRSVGEYVRELKKTGEL